MRTSKVVLIALLSLMLGNLIGAWVGSGSSDQTKAVKNLQREVELLREQNRLLKAERAEIDAVLQQPAVPADKP